MSSFPEYARILLVNVQFAVVNHIVIARLQISGHAHIVVSDLACHHLLLHVYLVD